MAPTTILAHLPALLDAGATRVITTHRDAAAAPVEQALAPWGVALFAHF